MINREFLNKHYSDILLSNMDRILSGGTIDDGLINAAEDKRMSLVLLIRISSDISLRIEDTIRELKKIEPDMYYYPPADFHITVMDILKGELNRNLPDNLDSYAECIKECLNQTAPFNIEFDGLTASDGAVMVRGYYDEGLAGLRKLLRETFRNNNLELQERYETVSSHITIARVKEKLSNPKGLLSYIDAEHYYGVMKVESMELCFHNWYDTVRRQGTVFLLYSGI